MDGPNRSDPEPPSSAMIELPLGVVGTAPGLALPRGRAALASWAVHRRAQVGTG